MITFNNNQRVSLCAPLPFLKPLQKENMAIDISQSILISHFYLSNSRNFQKEVLSGGRSIRRKRSLKPVCFKNKHDMHVKVTCKTATHLGINDKVNLRFRCTFLCTQDK